jgi:hypothetical protein
MSAVNSGPVIAKSGLVLDLDASYMRSYSPNVAPYPTDLFAWCGTAFAVSCTLSRDTTITRQYGSIPLKMTVTGSDSNFQSYDSSIWNLAPAANGQTWTISVWAKASVASTFGQIFIFPANASGNILPTFGAGTFTITNSWQRFSYTYTITGEATTAFIQMRLDGSNTAGEIIWFDGLQVERSSTATQFNPYYIGNTIWRDVSGLSNSFTLNNNPTYSNNLFTLNGTTQFFSISAASGFFISSTNNFYADTGYAWTISVWFKFPVSPTSLRDVTINGGNCSYCIFGNGGGIGGAETLALFVSGVSGTSAGFHPYYCVVGLRGGKTQLSLGSVNTNTWNNVIITWNGSAGRGYFNGVDRGALNNALQGMQVSGYTIGATAGGASAHLFEGNISLARVYNRALTAAEVSQNYEAVKSRFGL